jgi:hypothetical protein
MLRIVISLRRVSSLLRQFLIQFSESATSFTGSLIRATVESAGIEPASRTHPTTATQS